MFDCTHTDILQILNLLNDLVYISVNGWTGNNFQMEIKEIKEYEKPLPEECNTIKVKAVIELHTKNEITLPVRGYKNCNTTCENISATLTFLKKL